MGKKRQDSSWVHVARAALIHRFVPPLIPSLRLPTGGIEEIRNSRFLDPRERDEFGRDETAIRHNRAALFLFLSSFFFTLFSFLFFSFFNRDFLFSFIERQLRPIEKQLKGNDGARETYP